eukprot:m.175364 g.175364  ORF g.175364 m.175364 type:complete len:73 (+) comp14610_c0_seq3:37-255(+)
MFCICTTSIHFLLHAQPILQVSATSVCGKTSLNLPLPATSAWPIYQSNSATTVPRRQTQREPQPQSIRIQLS